MRTVAELTLGRESDTVPRARRMVRQALQAEAPELAADAELVVSELVTNAALHGEPPITVRVLTNHGVRVEVLDTGRSAPILIQQGAEAMTGRGLAMVAALVSAWGVDPRPDGGKAVWAQLDPDRAPGAVTAPTGIDLDALLEAWADDDPATATYTVRLGVVPTALLLEAKSHIDNVVRELVLMRQGQANGGGRLPTELAALIETVTVDFAEARTEIKRQAAAAAARNDTITELELHLSPSSVEAGERYLDALDEIDRYARSAHLLTLASPTAHRVFRRWYVGSLVDQLRALAESRPVPEPVPFVVVLSDELAQRDKAAAVAGRLVVIQDLTRELAGAGSPTEMAEITVEHAVRLLGVETARVRLMTSGGSLKSVAFRGRPGSRDHGIVEIGLDSPMPAAAAVRTRQPIRVGSMEQALDQAPELAAQYPPGYSGRAVPLLAGEEVLGALTLTFDAEELSDQAELAFVDSLAQVLAQALKQAAHDDLEAAHGHIRFILDATTRVMASLGSDDMLRTLARIAVPALADVCLIHLLDGIAFRPAAAAVSDAVRPEIAAELANAVPDPTGDHPAAQALRTGRAVSVDAGGPEGEERIRAAGAHSAIGVPLAARGRTLGAMTLLLVEPGRRYTESDIEMVEDLGRRVSLAVDNNQVYESARQAQERLALVARAGVSLTSSLDLPTVVGRLCELITGDLADFCEVHVRRLPAGWWRDGGGTRRRRLKPVDRLPPRVAEAVDTGQPAVGRWPAEEVFATTAPDDDESVYTVIPLMAHGEAVGVVALCTRDAGGATRVPAETVEVIAGRAALAVDNALLYEQERSAAEILQRSLLPDRLPAFPGLRVAARYLPAGARHEVGGDWYDVLPLGPDRVGVVMGDVMGRGIPAASIMGQLRNGLRMLAVQDIDPAGALELLNRLLGREFQGEQEAIATLAYGVIDIPARRLVMANAGHMPPVLRRGQRAAFLEQKPGLPLGAFPDSAYESTDHALRAGDLLVMYTDGLIERRDRDLDAGLKALLEVAAGVPDDPGAVCQSVLSGLQDSSDGAEEDDTAILAIRLDL